MTVLDTSTSATTDLVARLHDRRASIAVLGQGYVGLSLACAAAQRGFTLAGIDIDEERVAELSSGRPQGAGGQRTRVLDGRGFRAACTSQPTPDAIGRSRCSRHMRADTAD